MSWEDYLLGVSEAERQDSIANAEASQAISGIDANHENTTAAQRKRTRMRNAARKANVHPLVQSIANTATRNYQPSDAIAESEIRGAVGGWLPDEDEGVNVEPIIPQNNYADLGGPINANEPVYGLNRIYREFSNPASVDDTHWLPGMSRNDEIMYGLTNSLILTQKAAEQRKEAELAEAAKQKKDEVGWGENFIRNFSANTARAVAGLQQAVAENTPFLNETELGQQLIWGADDLRDLAGKVGNTHVNYDTEMDRQIGEHATNILQSVLQSLVTGGNPYAMGAWEAGNEYSDLREQGTSPTASLIGSAIGGATEGATEKIFGINEGFGQARNALLHGTGTEALQGAGRGLVKVGFGELPGETIATTVQTALPAILDPHSNPVDMNQAFLDTAIDTGGQSAMWGIPGAILGLSGHALARNRLRNQLNNRTQTTQNNVEASDATLDDIAGAVANNNQTPFDRALQETQPTVNKQGNVKFQGKQTQAQKRQLIDQHQSGGAMQYDADGDITKIDATLDDIAGAVANDSNADGNPPPAPSAPIIDKKEEHKVDEQLTKWEDERTDSIADYGSTTKPVEQTETKEEPVKQEQEEKPEVLFSKQSPSEQKELNDFAKTMKGIGEKGKDDGLFQTQTSETKDEEELSKEMAPRWDFAGFGRANYDVAKSGAIATADVINTNGEHAWIHAYPENRSGKKTLKIAVDASKLTSGKSGASELVQFVLNMCHNKGWQFEVDRQGLTKIGRTRAYEHLLSSALKFGTTKHISPASNITDVNQVPNGERHLNWKEGDDAHNILQLLDVTNKNIREVLPEINDFRYNLTSGKYEKRGKDGRFRNVKSVNGNPIFPISETKQRLAQKAGFGGNSIKRAILVQTIKQKILQENAKQSELLDEFATLASSSGLENVGLNGIFYQKSNNKTEQPTGKSTVNQIQEAIASDSVNKIATVVQSVSDLPENVRNEASSNTEGVYISDGRVFLVADNLTPERAVEVARHEVIGHYGIEKMLGGELMDKTVNQVIDALARGNKTLEETAKEVDKRQPGLSKEARAKEIIAMMAERNLHNNIVKRVLNAIRKFLSKMGLVKSDVTDAEIAGYLRDAREYLLQKNRDIISENTEQQVAYSKKSSETENGLFDENEEKKIGDVPKVGEQIDSRQQDLKEQLGEEKYAEMQDHALQKYQEARQNLIEKGGNATEEDIQRVQEAIQDCEHWGVTKDRRTARQATGKTTQETAPATEEAEGQKPLNGQMDDVSDTTSQKKKGEASWKDAEETVSDNNGNEPPTGNNEPDPVIDRSPNQNAFETPHETGLKKRWNDFIRAMQDRMIDLKRVQEAIRKAAGYDIADNANAYLAEEAYQPRLQEQHRQLREKFQNPIIRLIKKTGLSSNAVSRWLYARHVLLDNVNEKLQKRTGQADASGMTRAEAEKTYNEHKNNADMQKIGKLMDDMHRHVLDMQMREGMIDKATYRNLVNAYDHYVPLRDVDEDFSHNTSTGFNLLGNEHQFREGRNKEATANVIAQAFINTENAVRRIEKTRVTRALLKQVQTYKNDNLWKDEVPQNGNQNPPENVLVVRDEKGVDHWITFNKADPMSMHICEAFKNLDVANIPDVIQMFQKLNNYMGKWMTSKNPGFILRNLFRDVQGALFNLTDTPLNGHQHQVLANLPHAWVAMRNFMKNGTFANKDGEVSEYDKLCQEFIENGGKTNFVDMPSNVVGRTEQIEEMLERLNSDGTDKAGLFSAMGKVIEDTNAIAENAVRLATYITARQQGISIAKAISLAKNVSVNFGRRGTNTSWISAFYLFGNASIQGTARLVQAIAKSKTAKVVSGMMIGAGFLNRMLVQMMFGALNSGLDDDDPRISQFEKDNYWIIPYKFNSEVPDDFIKIPLPHGLRVFHMLGGYIADLCFNHKAQKNWQAYGLNTIINMVNDFTPLGNGSITQAFMPTFIQPTVGAYENTSGLGGEIVQRGNPNDPAYKNARWNTPKHYTWVSQLLNKITGGDDFHKGGINIQPNMIQHLIESYVAPGPMTDIDKALGGIEKVIDRMFNDKLNSRQRKEDEMTSKDIPFIGGFHGSPWHKWESYKDVLFDDNSKDEEEKERSKSKVRQGWGYDYKYHEDEGAVLQDMIDGKIPMDEKRLVTDSGDGQRQETLNGNDEILNGTLRVIDSANDSLYINTYEMSQPDIVKHIIMAKLRGVDVRIVVDSRQNHDKNSEIALQLLKNAGCDVNETQAWNIDHDKVIVADRKTRQTGSFNFSNNAVMNNKENTVIDWNNSEESEKTLRDGFGLAYHASHQWEAKNNYDKESGKAHKAPTKIDIEAARAAGDDVTEMERDKALAKVERTHDRYARKREEDALAGRKHKVTKGEAFDQRLDRILSHM